MIEFKILNGNLGVSLSGGADSSLVLYMLMREYSGEITIFNTVWSERMNHLNVVNNVYEQCKNLTGHTNSKLITTFIDSQYTEFNLFVTPLEYLKQGKLNFIYTGLTANPDINLKYSEQKINKRDHRRNNNIDEDNFYLPFVNKNKQTIATLYKEFNLMESLFPLTFSCVVSNTMEHCGACWWCEERKWGFGKL